MDVVLRWVFSLHRTEGVQPHVERYEGGLDSGVADAGEELRREVQPGSGGGGAARLAGVDCLVALRVSESASDVGRQRRMAHAFNSVFRRQPY